MKYFIFPVLLTLSACNTTSPEIIGSYYLIDWQGIRPDGTVVYPYGEQASGHLSYDDSGMMSMQLQRTQRELLGSDDYDSMDAELIREAYKGFFSYYGKYGVNQGVLTHTIMGCKNPDWVGRELKRSFSFSNDTLTIRSDSVIGMNHTLRWLPVSN